MSDKRSQYSEDEDSVRSDIDDNEELYGVEEYLDQETGNEAEINPLQVFHNNIRNDFNEKIKKQSPINLRGYISSGLATYYTYAESKCSKQSSCQKDVDDYFGTFFKSFNELNSIFETKFKENGDPTGQAS